MDLDKNHSDLENLSSSDTGNRKNGSSANEYDTCTTATISSPEPEEYTYEGAIQNYKSRIISRTQSVEANGKSKEKSPDKQTNGLPNYRRTSLGSKIENKLSSFEQRRISNTDLSATDGNKKDLPKVDISKKRELFEKEISSDSNGNAKSFVSRSPDAPSAKSIKDRLSHLEKLTEDNAQNKQNNILPIEVCSIKERLTSLEKHTNDTEKPMTKMSNGDLSNIPSVKDRMSSLKTSNNEEKINEIPAAATFTQNFKERKIELDIYKNNEIIPNKTLNNKIKLNGFEDHDFKDDSSLESHQTNMSSERNSSPESGLYDTKRFHRSVDSLDTDDNLPIEKFNRVQSSEDICGDSGMGIDTDREDSGIHTEDVSRAVSQADEPEQSPYTLLGSSTISQNTVVHLEAISPIPDADDSSKDEYFPVLSHTDDDPPTAEDFFDREEEDTVKSLDPDNSVSLQDISTTSESENVVFEGKMLIHLNFNDMNSKFNTSDDNHNNNKSSKSMACDTPMVMVSEMSTNKTYLSPKKNVSPKLKPKFSNDNSKLIMNEVFSINTDKFVHGPPILESNGRWTILQVNGKNTPSSLPNKSPILDMPEIIPINMRKEMFECNRNGDRLDNVKKQITNSILDKCK